MVIAISGGAMAALMLFLAMTDDRTDVVIRASPRVGRVIDARGVLVGEGLVLTAHHVVVDATRVEVDGRPGVIVRTDWKADLALVRIEAKGHRVARLGRPVAIGDEVHLAGWDWGLGIGPVRRKFVRDERTRFIVRSFEFETNRPGKESGAPVFNGEGKLVGIVIATPPLAGHRIGRSSCIHAACVAEIRAFLEGKRDAAAR